ncbi:hypothetical protein [Hydrogenophaga sp.]|uniref:hypothetical protein n=1 Tax=Hydrogenophaga sp. TaxID=1904254 RepID=UPI003D14E4F2
MMKVLKPNVMAPGMLVSSDAVEAEAAWSDAATYAEGDIRVYETGRYQSLQASNLNHEPSSSPTWWTLLGPSNTWAMFDDQVSTETEANESLEVVVNTGIIDTVAILGVNAQTAHVTVRDGPGGTVVYEETQSMAGEEVFSWYEYFFSDPTVRRSQAVFTGIPPFGSSELTVELTAAAGLQIGSLVFGRVKDLGQPYYGARAGITDYSRKNTDDFGTTTFVRRAYSKNLQVQLEVDNLQVNRVQRLLYDLRATPVVWLGSNRPEFSEPLVVFGFYKDFYCGIEYPKVSTYFLEIEGLI